MDRVANEKKEKWEKIADENSSNDILASVDDLSKHYWIVFWLSTCRGNLETHFTSRNFLLLAAVPDIAGSESITNVCCVLHSLARLLAQLVYFIIIIFLQNWDWRERSRRVHDVKIKFWRISWY
jgi:hypothetical protein